MADGATYPARIVHSDGTVVSDGSIIYDSSGNQPQPGTNPVTSGALAVTTAWASGTAKTLSATQQVTLYQLLTGDATNNAATCTVALSPDGTTFSTIFPVSLAAAVNNTGAITVPVTVVVPAGWQVKLTLAHMAAAAGTYA